MYVHDLPAPARVKVSPEEQAALEWVNEIRGRAGAAALQGLPQGWPLFIAQCPLARALQDAYPLAVVGSHKAFLHDDRQRVVQFPDAVYQFRLRFDAGAYPHLEA